MGSWTGTVPSHTAGAKLRASTLQTLDDIATALTSAWTTWSPTLANLTLGNAVQTARYRRLGQTVDWYWQFTLGTTSAVGTAPSFTLPVAPASTYGTGGNSAFPGGVHLLQTGALDKTLIVLTSDHGFRDKGLQSERSVYQIPLMFYASRFGGTVDPQLLSHLDFKDLLLHELLPDVPAPQENPFLMIIGPTGTSFLTVLTQPGQMLLMKAREGERYLVHQDGFAEAGKGRAKAGEFLRLFEDYLGYFEAI